VSNANRRPAVEGPMQSRRSHQYCLTETDKLKIAQSVEAMRRYSTWRHSYMLHLCKYYAAGSREIEGGLSPILLPPDRRPSLSQFKYWGLKHLRRNRL
jgi:hypothetical protein